MPLCSAVSAHCRVSQTGPRGCRVCVPAHAACLVACFRMMCARCDGARMCACVCGVLCPGRACVVCMQPSRSASVTPGGGGGGGGTCAGASTGPYGGLAAGTSARVDIGAALVGGAGFVDVWVNPTSGSDSNSGNTRAAALQTVSAAWRRIPAVRGAWSMRQGEWEPQPQR